MNRATSKSQLKYKQQVQICMEIFLFPLYKYCRYYSTNIKRLIIQRIFALSERDDLSEKPISGIVI